MVASRQNVSVSSRRRVPAPVPAVRRSLTTPRKPLDLVGPFRGECGFCGLPDARHRLYEAIQEQVRAGDATQFVADNYDMPVETIEEIAAQPKWRAPRRSRTPRNR